MGIRRLEGPVEPMRKTDITRRKHQDPKEVLEVAHSMLMGSRTNHRPYVPVFTDEPLGQHLGSRANPKPYMPTFTDEQEQHEQVEYFVAQLARSTREYYSLDMKVQRQMSLDQYCQLRFRN